MIQIEREKLEKVLEAFYSMKETLAENDEPTTFNEDEAITIIKDVLAEAELKNCKNCNHPSSCVCKGKDMASCGALVPREPNKQEHNILMNALKRSEKVVAQKDSEPVADEEISMPPYLCASYEGDDLYTGDQVRQLIKLVVDKKLQQKPMAWNGDCVLGHCNSPAGCEASNCCRADYTKEQL